MKTIVMLAASVVVAATLPLKAEFADGRLDIPTYTPGGYDKTPVFYTGRVYQGAQGRIYPYPAQDVLLALVESPVKDGKLKGYRYATRMPSPS